MAIEALLIFISSICGLDTSLVREQAKLDCIDFTVNCSVEAGGKISEEKAKECAKRFDGGERYARSE